MALSLWCSHPLEKKRIQQQCQSQYLVIMIKIFQFRRTDNAPHITAVFFFFFMLRKPCCRLIHSHRYGLPLLRLWYYLCRCIRAAVKFHPSCTWNFDTVEDKENRCMILTLKGQFERDCQYLLLSHVCFNICNKEYGCIWKPLSFAYINGGLR